MSVTQLVECCPSKSDVVGSNPIAHSKNMNKAIVLRSEYDWEMLYINSILTEEGHTLNEGQERFLYFLNISKKYNIKLENIVFSKLKDEDEDLLNETGRAPTNISEFKYLYY